MGAIDKINFDAVAVQVNTQKAHYGRKLLSANAQCDDDNIGVPLTAEQLEKREALAEKYKRGKIISRETIEAVRNKKVAARLMRQEQKAKNAVEQAALAEIMLENESGYLEVSALEKTSDITQKQLARELNVQNADKIFDLSLDLGPYNCTYSRNGRHLLLGGRKGHLAIIDWEKGSIGMEIQVQETIRDVTFLHNSNMFAVAQKQSVFIYDNSGIELHCLPKHVEINRLDFLPYHFLLTSIGAQGILRYQDTSTGVVVAEHRTRQGASDVLQHNPFNAVMHVGHHNGSVTMWSPNMTKPLVTMLCQRNEVKALAVESSGRYMITSGIDSQVNIWDLRMYKNLFDYSVRRPVTSIDISQRGVVALGSGSNVQTWTNLFEQKQEQPYIVHQMPGSVIRNVSFCPYQDVLGVSHSRGFSSIVVPGSGEPNFDAFEANPNETTKQRREREVHQLLEKLQPEMITLDPNFIGCVETASRSRILADKIVEENAKELPGKNKVKKQRGRNKSSKRVLKGKDKIEAVKIRRQKLEQEYDEAVAEESGETSRTAKTRIPTFKTALDRFR